ncbi:MAG: 30S ribosomal protein S15 [Elusimicrobia bacterium]|nr:30S ribosomal protein S15 [Elusimicrobiota bacterium]
MPVTKQKRQETITKFQKKAGDTGNTAVQVALITDRINHISSHLKSNSKDFSGERGLLKLVGQRRRLLDYLKNTSLSDYQKLIKQIDVRK